MSLIKMAAISSLPRGMEFGDGEAVVPNDEMKKSKHRHSTPAKQFKVGEISRPSGSLPRVVVR